MSALVRLARACTSVRRATTAFFQHDLAVRRDDAGVRIVLEPRAEQRAGANAQPASRSDAATTRAQQELALVRSQLNELLDAVPGTRGAARHLVFVEQALARDSLLALQRLPVDVLQKALEQIESMVTNWSPEGLANLRSKMAVAIIERDHLEPETEPDALRASATLERAANAAGLRDAGPPSQAAAGEALDDQALLAAYAAMGAGPVLPSAPATAAALAPHI